MTDPAHLDALLLARLQFAFVITVHIVFPALSIGLASYLAVLEGMWLKTRDQVYLDVYRYWLKIFALSFGMGVVSGVVMAYQFGTNWSGFSRIAGGITGPLLTYEVLTAFFLEAGFLGVMLFGMNRVGPALHFTSTVLVAIGTLVSTTWILASNSWMQTPQGHEWQDGRLVPVDWLQVIFSPSFPYRLMHMTLAAFLATALVVASCAAWHLLKRRDTPQVRRMLSMALWMLLGVAPLQAFIGDQHGLNTLEHQPAKLAAIEGHWERTPGKPVPLKLIGWPDMEAETTHFVLELPYAGSLLLTHSLDGQIPALKDFPKEDRPNSTIVFWSFRVMVGLGVLMIALALVGSWLRRRQRVYASPRFLKWALLMGPTGFVALIAGWITTEVGRQPWVVYGILRTADAVTPHPPQAIALSLAIYVVVYVIVFGAGAGYMLKLMRHAPEAGEATQPDHNSFARYPGGNGADGAGARQEGEDGSPDHPPAHVREI